MAGEKIIEIEKAEIGNVNSFVQSLELVIKINVIVNL
jgi:hypothetical protein